MSETVPEGWSFKKLSDVGKCIRGLTYSPDNVVENGLLVLRSSNIQNDQISLSDNIYVNIDVETEFLTQPSDILICVRNGSRHLLGKSAFIDNKLPRATHGAFMTIYRSELNDFFRHHIKSDQFFIQVSRDIGATINSINTGNLLEYKFLTPPLPEQKKIASILTSVDDVIENTQRQIDKLQELKKATMNALLTKGIGHTEFKDSELGRIPKSWEVQALNQICIKIQDGTHFSPPTGGNDFKYITSKNIKMGQLDLTNVETVSEAEHKKIYKRCDVIFGDILLTKDGANTGNVAINYLEEQFSLLSSVAFIRPDKDKCDAGYLMQFLMSDLAQNEISEQVSGNAITRLTLTKINNFKIILPALSEQIDMSSTLSSIDQLIIKNGRKLAQTQSLKKSLMQDLLTGKVRVQV